MKNHKPPGKYELLTEIISGNEAREKLDDIFNMCLTQGKIPQGISRSRVFKIEQLKMEKLINR